MTEAEKIRTFIAVPVSSEVRAALAELQSTLRRRGISLRWVQPENLHFTLKFLGNIDPAIVMPLGDQLRRLALQTSRFQLSVGGVGAFPNLRNPRVLWVGLRQGAEPLEALAREVSQMVKEFPTEADNKPFKPHLTIGRAKDRPQRLVIPEALLQASFGSCPCDRLILMQSKLGPGGSQYTPLVEAALSNG